MPWPILALATLLAVAACYPGGPENAADSGLTVTARVPGVDYADLQTFAMEDNVILLETGTDPEPLPDLVEEAILEQLRASMVAAGFQDVSPDTATVTPDVWVVVGANQTEVWFYTYGWGYYGGWWGPGYGYYPPYVGVDSFQAGSVVWGLMDLRGVDPGAPDVELQSIWYAGLNGALSNSESNTVSRVRSGIQQAFTQSPYIKGTATTKQEDGS
jgi:hypothetical protein